MVECLGEGAECPREGKDEERKGGEEPACQTSHKQRSMSRVPSEAKKDGGGNCRGQGDFRFCEERKSEEKTGNEGEWGGATPNGRVKGEEGEEGE